MKRTEQLLASPKPSSVSSVQSAQTEHDHPRGDLKHQILHWLLHYPFQRIDDIAVGLDTGERTVARALQSLTEQHLVDSVNPSVNRGNRHGWYYLTTSGLYRVGELEGCDPVTLARTWHADERHLLRLLPRFYQIVTLQNIVHSLVSSSPVALSYAGSQAEIRWGWQREYLVTLKTKRQVIRCEADAAVVLRRRAPEPLQHLSPQEEFFTLLVYLDLGQRSAFTDRTTMIRKLRNLLLYRESQERQPYHSMFPCLLIIVESARQFELWQQATMEAARQLRLGKPLDGVILNRATAPRHDCVVPEKEGSRSLWNSNWRVLATNRGCHLQEMLVPMTALAVPPGIITHLEPTQRGATPPVKTLAPRRKTLIRGHYHERLESLQKRSIAGSVLSLTQERELTALLGLYMSERYREIVLLLYANPLLSVGEIAVLGGLHARTANRYLLTLEQWGCTLRISQRQYVREITKNQTPTPESRDEETPTETLDVRWVLSVRGLRYLAASMNASETTVLKRQPRQTSNRHITNPQVVYLRQHGVFQLYREWSHTAGVYHCLVAFYRSAQSQPSHSIAWSETHFRCARRYRVNGTWHNFRPDAVLEYVVRQESVTERFHLWLEWDNGTMGNKALHEKMRAYSVYMRSLEWRRRINTGAIPLLLIIVPDRSQQDRMTRLVREAISSLNLHVRITTQEFLQEYGPLAKIWTAVLPLPPEQTTRLRRLLDMEATDPTSC